MLYILPSSFYIVIFAILNFLVNKISTPSSFLPSTILISFGMIFISYTKDSLGELLQGSIWEKGKKAKKLSFNFLFGFLISIFWAVEIFLKILAMKSGGDTSVITTFEVIIPIFLILIFSFFVEIGTGKVRELYTKNFNETVILAGLLNGIGYFLANFLLSKNLKCSTEIVSILSAQVIVGVFWFNYFKRKNDKK